MYMIYIFLNVYKFLSFAELASTGFHSTFLINLLKLTLMFLVFSANHRKYFYDRFNKDKN